MMTLIPKLRNLLQHSLIALCLLSSLPFTTTVLANQTLDVNRMKQAVTDYVDDGTFMGSVLIARDDQLILHEAYGSANLEWDIPNTTDSVFHIASISKQFTAAAILLLEEQGKLSIDDTISKYLPDSIPAWNGITFRQLLNHSAGIPDFTQFADYKRLKTTRVPIEDIIAVFSDKALDFTPGDKMHYSNSGYVLLGYLIEQISQQSYGEYLQRNIFEPLGMHSSGFDTGTNLISNRAEGYAAGANGSVIANYIDMSTVHAAGALYSTTTDLYRWVNGLFSGALLSQESLSKMTTAYQGDYGFGLAVINDNGDVKFQHGGAIDGYTSELIYYPKQKLTIIVLSNLFGSAPAEISRLLAQLAHNKSVVLKSERTEANVSGQVLKNYVGTYEIGNHGANARVTLLESNLIMQFPDMPPIALLANSTTEFFFQNSPGEIAFKMDKKGQVSHFEIDIQGQEIIGKRISGAVTQRKKIQIPAEELAGLVGTYNMHPGFNIDISIERGKLQAQATGQPAFTLYAETNTLYFAEVVDLQIEFNTTSKGEVNYLTVLQGPHKTKARRVR